MAELLTYQQLDEERQLGFRAAEKARLNKAWHLAVLYESNAVNSRIQSDLLNHLLHLLSLITVFVVALKSAWYPDEDDAAETLRACKSLEDRRRLTSSVMPPPYGMAEVDGYGNLYGIDSS